MSGIKSLLQSNKEKLNTFYQSKSPSEQRLIVLLVVSFVLFIVVSSYMAVSKGLAETEKKLQRQLDLNAWATQQIALIQQSSSGSSQATASGSMTQVINSTARRFNITLARLQPQQANYVKVGLEDANFNQLLRWLELLQNTYGITAANIDISKSDTDGIVRVRRLDLERI